MRPTNVPVSSATGVPGWRNAPMEAEEKTIIRLASDFIPDDGIAVEIGTEYGRGASEIAFGVRQRSGVQIFSIDLFPMDHGEVGDLLACWMANIEEAMPLFPKVRFFPVRGSSAQVGEKLIAEGKLSRIDYLFVDGAHDTGSVRRDLETFAPLVNGVILIHDYWKTEASHPIHKDVKQAVDDWFNPDHYNRIDLPGSLLAFMPYAPAIWHDETVEFAFEDIRETVTDDEAIEPVGETQELTIGEIADHLGVSYHKAREFIAEMEPVGKRGRANVYRVVLGNLQ